MSIDRVEQQLRDAYTATTGVEFGPAGSAPQPQRISSPRRARAWIPAAAAAATVAGLAIGTTLLVGGHSDHRAGSPPPSTHGSTASIASTPTSSAPGPARALPADGRLLLGVPYPYRLFVHCGAPIIGLGGQSWQPVPPVPVYPGAHPVGGVTTETGYVAGVLELLGTRSLRFTADPSAVLSPYAVMYEPAPALKTQPVCS